MKKKDNNRGFTLVELIIAVAILALAVSPLVANFIQSSKMNLKGRKSLNAMNLAQDVMEGLSGYSADEVNKLVEDINAGTVSLAGTILPKTASHDAQVSVETTSSAPEVLKYRFKNVETISTEHNKYDVLVTLDPTGTPHKDLNGKEVADISEINQFYDVVYTVPKEEIGTAIIQMHTNSGVPSVMEESYRGEVIRTTYITIGNKGTETAPNYYVSSDRVYSITSAFANKSGLPNSLSVTYANGNISRTDSKTFPRSVYIYFEGIENAAYSNVEKRERFYINNITGKEIDVYLIRTQKTDENGKVGLALATYGQNFGCTVEVESTDFTGHPSVIGANNQKVNIISNLRYDLNAESQSYNYRTFDEDGNTIPEEKRKAPKDASGNIIASTYEKERAEYYYNGTKVSEAVYQTNFSDGYERRNKNTVYKATIEIFPCGKTAASDRVAKYEGGVGN